MRRFKRILLVYDGREQSEAAFQRALDLSRRNEALLTMSEVLEEVPPAMRASISPTKLTELQEILTGEAQGRLGELVKRAEEEGVRATGSALWGTPFVEIIREVIRNSHDLVMLSPRRRSRLQEMVFRGDLLGSRTMHLMRKCPRPVWVIKPSHRKPFARVLAAVDVTPTDGSGSQINMKIMELATSVSVLEKSELHVLHVWKSTFEKALRSRSGISQATIDKMVQDIRRKHKGWLGQLVEKTESDGLLPHVHLLEGEPDDLIVDMAKKKQVELVVMGTVCRTGLAGFFIGNTAEKVLSHLDCSILAVKPEGFVTPVTLE